MNKKKLTFLDYTYNDVVSPTKLLQFNPRVLCTLHQRICTLQCHFPYCSHKIICKECLSSHPDKHFSFIVPFKQENIIAEKFIQQLANLRTNLAIAGQGMQVKKEEQLKELNIIVKEIEELIQQEWKKFAANLFKFVDQFYADYEPKFMQTLYQISSQEKVLEEYTKYDKDKIYSAKEITQLLELQQNLHDKIFPDLTRQANSLINEYKMDFLGFQKQKFVNMAQYGLEKIFKVSYLIRTSINSYNVREEHQEEFQFPQLKTPKSNNVKQNEDFNPQLLKSLPNLRKQFRGKATRQAMEDIEKLRQQQKSPKQIHKLEIGESQTYHVIGKHQDIITCLITLSSKHKFASAGGDKIIKCWDFSEGRLIAALKGHTNDI